MAKQYYYLVASLPDLMFEHEAKGFDLPALKEYIKENVSKKDYEKVKTLFLPIDNDNILNQILKSNTPFIEGGNLSKEIIEQTSDNKSYFPTYLVNFFNKINAEDEDNDADEEPYKKSNIERNLLESFYSYTNQSKNKFINQWFTFDKEIRNIQAAYIARQVGFSIESSIIGNDDITKQLIRSNAADFALRNEREYLGRLFQALEITDILERERKLDALRWWYIEEITTFEYFSLDIVLAFLQKAQIIHRWMLLDKETGNAMFAQLVQELKGSYNIDTAFK